MNPKILIAGAAIAAMTAVSAHAASSSRNAGAYAEPGQPIAYSQVGAYLKASPKARRTRDWSGGTAVAASNAGSNASATTPPPTANPGGSMPISTQTRAPDANVSDTPPTVSPQVNTAPSQPPLNQAPPSNAQPPASNAPATTDQAGAPAPQ